jgi:uncharacterized membrane protein YdjX (TVP38/TMEM64 family)
VGLVRHRIGSCIADSGGIGVTKGNLGRLIKLLLAATVVVLAVVFLKPQLEAAVEWVRGLGAWGPLALGVIYAASCVLFVPGFILTVAAGGLFGVVTGSITVSIASTIGATLAMLVGRYLARGWVSGLVAGNERFAAVDRAVAREGLKIVLLTRLSPVFPFNLLNFSYGLTGVSVKDYLLGSWVGMMPGTVMYVYIGAVFGEVAASAERERTAAEWALYVAGLMATVIVTIFVTRIARRALAEAAPDVAESGSTAA